MYADPKVYTPFRRKAGIALDHAALHLNCTTHRFDGAAEFDQDSVAGTLHDAPVVHSDGRVKQIASERPKPRQCTIFVGPGEAAVANYVGRQYCRALPEISGYVEVYSSLGKVSIAVPRSALCHFQTLQTVCLTSAFPPKADIRLASLDVFVPNGDLRSLFGLLRWA